MPDNQRCNKAYNDIASILYYQRYYFDKMFSVVNGIGLMICIGCFFGLMVSGHYLLVATKQMDQMLQNQEIMVSTLNSCRER